ncbi:MAG: hypothetical protein ACR2RF_17880 [Geminicoccaceae bacterium]
MTISASEPIARPMGHQMEQAFSAFLQKVRCWYRRRRDLKEARAAFMHTVYLDDRLLDDMGVTREEVRWAASLPLEENAALALRERAAKRRAAQTAARLR